MKWTGARTLKRPSCTWELLGEDVPVPATMVASGTGARCVGQGTGLFTPGGAPAAAVDAAGRAGARARGGGQAEQGGERGEQRTSSRW
jgi:hypothetical protein